MTGIVSFLRRHQVKIVALALVGVAYGFTRLPTLDPGERSALADRFRFERVTLPASPEGEVRSLRPVHPSLDRLSAWISAVGAAVALADLDGDGLPNDVCHVDTRTDRVVISPAPGDPGAERYAPFVLDPAPLPYDQRSTAPMGCVPGDLDENGSTDLLVYYWGRTPIAFLSTASPLEAAAPTAAHYRPREVAPPELRGQRWYTNAATRADFDGDGHVDLVFGNYFQDDAWILGRDVGEAHDRTERMQHSMSRSFNGGKNRIFLWAGAGNGDDPGDGGPDVSYRDAPVMDDDVAHSWTLAVGAADLDGDLLPEIYFSNDFGPDRLLHNRSRPGRLAFAEAEGRRHLTTVRSKVIGHDSFKGMGIDFADLNDDGYLDLYVSNIAAEWSLEESHFVYLSTGDPAALARGEAPYRDRGEELGLSRSGWGWESRFGDFDNDGVQEAVQATGFVRGEVNRWPELHELAMGNDEMLRHPTSWPQLQEGDDLSGYQHNPFFVRSSSGRYFDLAPDLGIDGPHVTRAIATADMDGDGRLDFAVGNMWDDSYVYRNRSAEERPFLGLHLVLPTEPAAAAATESVAVYPGHPDAALRAALGSPVRSVIGAVATVRHPDGRRLTAQVDGGNGHSGVRSPDLHFGLGAPPGAPAAGSIDEVEVTLAWRDGSGVPRRQTVRLAPGWHTIVLGTTESVPTTPTAVPISGIAHFDRAEEEPRS